MSRDLWLEHMEHRSGCDSEPDIEPAIKAVCAWCRKVTREGVGPVTHGICDPCKAKMMADDSTDPLDSLLHDSFYREKFNLAARKL